nr:MAG TPA: hypothetical protein [Caudoviricetes sp.]
MAGVGVPTRLLVAGPVSQAYRARGSVHVQ